MLRQVVDRVRGHAVHSALVLALTCWLVAAALHAGRPVAAVVVAFATGGALAVGTWVPLLSLGVSFAGLFSVDILNGGRGLEDPMLAALVLAAFLVGRWARLTLQPWAGAGVLLLLSTNVFQPGRELSLGDTVFPTVITAAPWLLGLAMQLSVRRADHATSYAAALTDTRHEELRRATDAERLRIAHELHDIVAHHMSVVSLRAQVARRSLEAGDPVSVDEMTALEETARSALLDLRRLLGVLRPDAAAETAPQQSLGDLEALLESCRRAGQEVCLVTDGVARDLPPALSVVTYRILQEALTNARRHGGPGPTSVYLDWSEGMLQIRVLNPFAGLQAGVAGHGRLGMAERARLFGGTVTTTATARQWVVEVRLPTPEPVSEVRR